MTQIFKFNNKQLILSIIFIISASFYFALGSIITKILGTNIFSDGINPIQIAHARFTFAFLMLIPISVFYKVNFKSQYNTLKFIVLRVVAVINSAVSPINKSIWLSL